MFRSAIILTFALALIGGAPIHSQTRFEPPASKDSGPSWVTETVALFPLNKLGNQGIVGGSYYLFECGYMHRVSDGFSLGATVSGGLNLKSDEFSLLAGLRARKSLARDLAMEMSFGVPLATLDGDEPRSDFYLQTSTLYRDLIGITLRAEFIPAFQPEWASPRYHRDGFTEFYGGVKIGKTPGLVLGIAGATAFLVAVAIIASSFDFHMDFQ